MSKIPYVLAFAALAAALAIAIPATAEPPSPKVVPAVTPGNTALPPSSANLFPAFLVPARPPDPGLVEAAYPAEGDGGIILARGSSKNEPLVTKGASKHLA